MNKFKYLTLYLLSLAIAQTASAREFVGPNGGGNRNNANNTTTQSGNYRAACVEARAETDLNINNVRARLRTGGDVWRANSGNGSYIVPNVDPASGQIAVSSLYAGAIWLGAYDDGGNLILAAQTFRDAGNDYWTGPLDTATGTTEKSICENWDRHFRVTGADIDALRADFLAPDASGQPDLSVDVRPSRALLGWPGRGNPHFASIYGFDLPDQDLAPFIEHPSKENYLYDPMDGDHPIIEVDRCGKDYNNPVYADEMIWWVYNDRGNLHTQSQGQPMSMEIQALAFGYRTTDAINNMTFYRYKLLNRNSLALKDTYFSLWTDPDLGCHLDDMIGCDTITGMGYVYNKDNYDDLVCGSGGVGYGSKVPSLGVDYFRGPKDEFGNEIGLSSFQYHIGSNDPGMGDPGSALSYYRLMSGFWSNGVPVTRGGTGYNPGSTDTIRYVFPSFPNQTEPGAWSMCNGGTTGAGGDFRFLHTSGPFKLMPGATNELISGVVWIPETEGLPCPRLTELVAADVLAQNLFDDCFKITDGPDAPFMDVVELENEIILNLSYTSALNNYQLAYKETPSILRGTADSAYVFEGYKIYQVVDANTSVTDLENTSKARLIYQSDLKNGVGKIVNWSVFDDPDVQAFVPKVMVDGEDKGISHSFRVTADQFANPSAKLVNHKPYYFCVVAYGYNQYEPYNFADNTGQATPYLQGRRNFRIYTAIPRNISPEYYGAKLNAVHGEGPDITRVDGRGNGGGLFLDFVDRAATEEEIFANGRIGEVTYAGGKTPIQVKIVDPLRVAKGTFQLYIYDSLRYQWNIDTINNELVYTPVPPTTIRPIADSTNLKWLLKDKNDPSKVWQSFQTLDVKYEHLIPELGIALNIQQVKNPGINGESGFIGSTVEYPEGATPWYKGVTDANDGLYNMLKTGNAQADNSVDPNQEYSTSVEGWYPVELADCRYNNSDYYFTINHIQDPNNAGNSYCSTNRNTSITDGTLLSNLRNVNVVLTPDKSKWSRCIVVETSTFLHTDASGVGLGAAPSGYKQFEWKRTQPSVDKEGNQIAGETGYSWFPGYAYDVETGERLNIFFGENSFYNGSILDANLFPGSATGNDMIYNPTNLATASVNFGGAVQYLNSVLGGQHIIYVAKSAYDECATLVNEVYNRPVVNIFTHPFMLFMNKHLVWGSMSYLQPGTFMDGPKGNIPPSEALFKLRVAKPYDVYNATGVNSTYPLYEFSLDKYAPTKEDKALASSALDLINVVPNPYYAYSDYEATEIENVIKVTNLPAKCDVRIYSLDGRFIRQYNISQNYNSATRNGIARIGAHGSGDIEEQITTSINWDLKNFANVPVSSGVYLIHVVVPGVGEKVLKSFIINRAFDSQKL